MIIQLINDNSYKYNCNFLPNHAWRSHSSTSQTDHQWSWFSIALRHLSLKHRDYCHWETLAGPDSNIPHHFHGSEQLQVLGNPDLHLEWSRVIRREGTDLSKETNKKKTTEKLFPKIGLLFFLANAVGLLLRVCFSFFFVPAWDLRLQLFLSSSQSRLGSRNEIYLHCS